VPIGVNSKDRRGVPRPCTTDLSRGTRGSLGRPAGSAAGGFVAESSIPNPPILAYVAFMDWITTIVTFLGGGALATVMTLRGSRRDRLLDAYTEYAGTVAELQHISIDAIFGQAEPSPAWLRFGAARARLLLQEGNKQCQVEIDKVTDSLDELYTFQITLGKSNDRRAESAKQQTDHIQKMKVVSEQLDQMVARARDRLAPWF
jgi:hypothetical protein